MRNVCTNTKTSNELSARKYDYKYVSYICALFFVLILARAVNDVGFYIFAAVSFIVILISNIGHCISFLFFLLPFFTILKKTPEGMSFFTILFFLLILKMVVLHKKIDVRLLIALAVFFAFGVLFSGLENLTTIITMVAGILMLYYMRNSDVDIDISAMVGLYSIGICLAAIFALCKGYLPIIDSFITDITLRLPAEERIVRFAGLQGNPNYYTLDITIALSAIIALGHYNRKTPKLHMILMIALSILGIMSISKSFLLSWILLMLCWAFLVARKSIKDFIKLVVFAVIAMLLIYILAYDYINAYLFRFVSDSSGTLDKITTGRSTIFLEYFQTLVNDLKIFFLGNGLGSIIESLGYGTHNTYLECLFNLGIIGTMIFMMAIVISMGRVKFKGVAFLPLFMLLFRMLAIGLLTYDYLWFYLAICLGIAYDYQNKRKERNCIIEKKL